MADGNKHLLDKDPDKQSYSAMDVQDPESSSGASLVDSDENCSSMKINKRALVVFFGVTTLAAAVIVVAVVVSLYSVGGSKSNSRLKRDAAKFTLDDMLQGTYGSKFYQVKWLSDDDYMVRGEEGSVDIINPSKNTSVSLVKKEKAKSLGVPLVLSPDRRMILFPKNKTMEYRYSSYADYFVYDIELNKEQQIKTNGDTKIKYVAWAPTGSSLVYVTKNDMYYIDKVQLPLPASIRLTNTGKEHLIFNGVPDWVYQEEVLNAEFALYFSKKSTYLTYIEFDDTYVKNFVFPWYGSSSNEYTTQHKIAYPKPGTSNPLVKVKVIDLTNPLKILEVPKPSALSKVDHYVVDITWLTDSMFSVQWLTRDQNYSIINLCEPVKSPTRDYISCNKYQALEQHVINGWVNDQYMSPILGRDYYLITYPFPQGNDGSFTHIAKVDIMTGQAVPITSGKWEVTKVYAFDDQRELLFFESTQVSPTTRNIYSVSIRDKKISCLSCNVPEAISGKSTYFRASFSDKGSWYILQSQGPSVPWSRLYSSKDPSKVVPLENNQVLKEKLKKLPMGRTEILKVPSDNNDIYTKIVYPPFFDERKKYAVLFFVYGGPGTQSVIDTWSIGFETGYLSHNFDIIIVYVDARGTIGRGERFKHAVFHQLGKYEAIDTINVAKYMQTLPYVDKDKIAIWGWSYGGYLTSYILGQNSGVFKLGMAVAPVADWRYYDSIYTERYMGIPQYNKIGYKESSVLPLAKNFKNVDYLLVHGTADDNVHFQNTAQLVKKLTAEEIDYQVQFYTDKNHGLSGDGTPEHLYHLLSRFLKEKGIAFSSS